MGERSKAAHGGRETEILTRSRQVRYAPEQGASLKLLTAPGKRASTAARSVAHGPARVAAAVALATLMLTACGSNTLATLNTTQLARAIEQSIFERQGIRTAVSCPPRPPQKAGYKFVCAARLAVGSYAVDAVEIDARGRVRYTGATPLGVLDSHVIERAIERDVRGRHGLAMTVACPAPVLEEAGLAFTCTARSRRGHDPFVVTEMNGSGSVRVVGR